MVESVLSAVEDPCIIRDFLSYSLIEGSEATPVDAAFRFISARFPCERVYIFELTNRDTTFSNTYEWCAEGVIPQMEMLQNEPIEAIDWWLELFEDDQPVFITDLEDIRTTYPRAYAALKPQDIDALITYPLRRNGKLIGFIGVDNPQLEQMSEIVTFFSSASDYIVAFLLQNNRIKDLNYIAMHDPLTGALNRSALRKKVKEKPSYSSIGVVYSDITGLKRVNEYLGHSAGDQVIVECYRALRSQFDESGIYRVGGDEFVCLWENCSRQELEEHVRQLQMTVQRSDQHVAVGSVWSDDPEVELRTLFPRAESSMFSDKYLYHNRDAAPSRSPDKQSEIPHESKDSEFYRYARNNYFNPEVLMEAVAATYETNYIYFGDLQTNLFYISDNMRDTFGFSSNIVSNLISAWENRISNAEDLHMYRRDVADVINRAKFVHDLRYRVLDAQGNEMWIRCRGHAYWSEDGKTPLFFAGCIVRLEHDLLADPITGFPRELTALNKIAAYQAENSPIALISFGLNSFGDINELRGRNSANRLLTDIARRINESFHGRLSFYRLDGLRFLAIKSPLCQDRIEMLAERLREIIVAQYQSHNVMVRRPCAIGIMNSFEDDLIPSDVVSRAIALLTVAKTALDQDYVILSPEALEEHHSRAEMVFKLSKNVQNHMENFWLVVQPTVSTADGKIIGGETLLRWKFNGNPVPPDVFIPLLEKNRLISSVGRWVFERVVRTTRRVLSYNPGFQMAFNVSYLQVLDSDFFPYMEHILKTYDMDASHLTLELTETNFDDSPQKLKEFFDSCRKLGIHVALDDFGNGYSSIGLLLKYPTNIVKLDRALLHGMTTSFENKKFIESIVSACHVFGKEVCAEGVETEEDFRLVRDAGCDLIQGFYFHRPLELDDFFRVLTEASK